MNNSNDSIAAFGRWISTLGLGLLFVIGNILLPQLCHIVPMGGPRWLPIYFFTLVGAYCFGWRVGLFTALLSPVLNSLLFGMPALPVLPSILLKSIVLALAAAYAAKRSGKVTLLALGGIVLAYQLIGSLGEWGLSGSLQSALQDFHIGVPGMLLQIFGGYFVIRQLEKRRQA
jgi:hypothetical protein